jgi:hypothetical protein
MKTNLNSALELAKRTAEVTELEILSQLNDFIKRDLIEVQYGQLIFFQEMDSTAIKVSRTVKLVLKDKEYIEKLEKDNEELRSIISKLKGVL